MSDAHHVVDGSRQAFRDIRLGFLGVWGLACLR
jgi:hypothetical protein